MRRRTRQIRVGGLAIGGDAPISVQSMTNTDTRDVAATVAQIRALQVAGCELVRVAVPDARAAAALAEIKRQVSIPLVADIHFNYRLALQALEAGVDGLRLNPGNIGGPHRVRAVVLEARRRGVPIRIGVNAGSLEASLVERYGVSARAMVESALGHIRLLEDLDYREIKVSLKAASVPMTVEAYSALAEKVDYPFHLGITEAGTLVRGAVKSAVGLGILLSRGLGDTLRVSLTGDPCQEVLVGFEILKALALREKGLELVSCPTCGRCEVDLEKMAREVEERLQGLTVPVRVAVMGCVVNGPGEARVADVGIAGGRRQGLLFRRGEVVARLPQEQLVEALLEEVRAIAERAKEEEEV